MTPEVLVLSDDHRDTIVFNDWKFTIHDIDLLGQIKDSQTLPWEFKNISALAGKTWVKIPNPLWFTPSETIVYTISYRLTQDGDKKTESKEVKMKSVA